MNVQRKMIAINMLPVLTFLAHMLVRVNLDSKEQERNALVSYTNIMQCILVKTKITDFLN